METVHAEMMKRHLGNDYDEFEPNKLMPASYRLLFLLECVFFSLQSVIYFDYLTTYVYINLLKIINISIVYSQLDTEPREREKTGVGQTQNDVHHSVLDRLHHKSEMYTSFHSPEHVKHADVSKSKSRNSNLYDTSIRIENSSMTEARHARTREKTVV